MGCDVANKLDVQQYSILLFASAQGKTQHATTAVISYYVCCKMILDMTAEHALQASLQDCLPVRPLP